MSGGLSTGGIDSSIPLQAGRGVAPPNPLATIGEFANLQNALNQNKMFPGALALQGGQQTLQGQQIQAGQSGLIQQQRQLGAASLVPLLASKKPLTIDDVTTALGGAEKSGVVTQPTLADFAGIPMTGNPALDDAAIRAHIAANSQAPAQAASQVTPQAGPIIDTGRFLKPTTVSPAGSSAPGVVTPAGMYPKGLTPEGASTPTTIGVTPQGAPITGTRQQFIDQATGQPSPLGTGRLPAALLNPANQPPQGVVTGQGPAQQAQEAAQGATSAHAFQDIADQGMQARGQNAVLGNMLGDIANFKPGPQLENQFKATIQRYAPALASVTGATPESVAANESFDKLANQIAGAQGERSDARLAVAQGANPGSHLSPAGADLILRQLQGNADYLQARSKVAATYPDQTNRAGFEASVGQQLDPRAFQFARMTPQQKTTYYAGLSDADKGDVKSSYNSAVKMGLIGGN